MLDNVIDINYYSVPQAEQSNMRHRPIGLGLMGFQDALYKIDVSYASEGAVEFADRSMEAISYFAIEASSELAARARALLKLRGLAVEPGHFPAGLTGHSGRAARCEQYIAVNKDKTLDWACP